MIIYGEYLFIENFVTGCLLLLLTAKISGKEINRARLLAAGLLCGAGGFSIFLPAQGFTAAAMVAVAGAAAAATAFGFRGIFKNTLLFISLTFLSGGTAMAFLLWHEIPAISGSGAFYTEPVTYVQLVLWAAGAFGLTYLFIRLIKERRLADITKGKVCLTINGRSYWFEALVDSGNSLREPLTGRPVMLMDSKGAARLPVLPDEKYVIVPYRAIGTEKGMLRGFRADRLEFNGKQLKGAVIAFYSGDFGEPEMLLNREVLNDYIEENNRSGRKVLCVGRKKDFCSEAETGKVRLLHRRK